MNGVRLLDMSLSRSTVIRRMKALCIVAYSEKKCNKSGQPIKYVTQEEYKKIIEFTTEMARNKGIYKEFDVRSRNSLNALTNNYTEKKNNNRSLGLYHRLCEDYLPVRS